MGMALRGKAEYCTNKQYPGKSTAPQGPVGRRCRPLPMATRDLHQMRIIKKMEPKAHGAKKLANRFGDDLVCVRYRQDRESKRRYTTVEIVVDAGPMPEDKRIPAQVLVRIGFDELDLRQAAMQQGAIWVAQQRAWRISREAVKHLQLHNRIIRK